MITCTFSDVTERDMDLLFMEEFVCSPDFLNLFLQKIDLLGATVVSVEQSKTDKDLGESDITVVVEKDGIRHGLLIEDKIDAVAQPQQATRYFARGEKESAKQKGEYAAFSVFIVAPQGYLDLNEEANKYPYKVSYEECLAFFKGKDDSRSAFKQQQIEQAIEKQKRGWQAVTDETVTKFWNEYDAYQEACFSKLDLIKTEKGKPSRSFWREFRTDHTKIRIVHKAERGCVDMQFSGLADKKAELVALWQNCFGNLFEQNLQVDVAGKSAIVHRPAPMEMVDFSRSFAEQKEIVEKALQEANRLRTLLDDLPKEELYALFE